MSGQVINITINVSDGNASEAVQQVVAQLNAIGPAGERAGAQAGAGLDQVGEHALSARENVHLLNEDLGLRIPRAMQSVIANSQMMSAAIGMAGTGLVALGAVDIFVHMGESVYNLYEKYISLNSAQDEFIKAQKEAKDKDFINVHSLETAVERLDEAQKSMSNMKAMAESLSGYGWQQAMQGLMLGNVNQFSSGAGQIVMAHNFASDSAHSAQQAKDLALAENALFHQGMLAQIETAHAIDAALKGQAKITAELQKQLEINRENQAFFQVQESQRGNMGAASTGNTEREEADKMAKDAARAKEIELRRQETNQIIQMQNEATNAGLQGNALRAAQEQEAIEAVTRKFQEGELSKRAAASETAAIQQRFAAQALILQEQLDEQTRHLADEAAQAGQKGLPLINSQLRTQLDAINAAEDKAVGKTGIETPGQNNDFASQRESAWKISRQKMTESTEQFNEHLNSLVESSNNYQLQGYSRIEAETQKHLDSLAKEYEGHYGKDQTLWAEYQQRKTQLEADGDRDLLQLHTKTMEQITKEEQQAARMSLPEWQQAKAQIVDTYNDRVNDLNNAEQRELETFKGTYAEKLKIENDFNSQRVAASDLANAQMQQADARTRDKLAQGLQSLFSNPAQFVEKRAMDMAAEMMATDLMAYFKNKGAGSGVLQWLFGMSPEMSMSTNPGDQLGSVLGGSHASTNSGMMLNTAGTTLMDAGNIHLAAANELLSAATALQYAAGVSGFGGGTSGMGSLGGSFSDMPDASGMAGLSNTGSSQDAGGNSIIDAASIMPTGSGESSSISQATLDAQSFGATAGTAGKWAGVAGGALTAGMGIYSAYENSDPTGGMLTGAMGGAEIGSMFGPMGMAVGGIIGGVAGLLAGVFGDQGRGKAEDFDKNTVQPGIAKEIQDFESGRAGYNSASKEIAALLTSAKDQTSAWGSGARSYFSSHIQPEIEVANSTLQQQEKGGRSLVTMSAAQYHTGGWVGDFGDFGTGPGEGFAKLLAEEFVVQPMAARAHAPLLSAINAGNVSYSRTPQAMMPAASGGGASLNLTIKAIDSKDVARWAAAGGGRDLIAALNQAQRQYSGVGRG